MDEDAYQAYRSVIVSPTLRSIWAEVYGDRFCAGFSDAWMTPLSTRADGRRPRSAKARNRG
jgi:hypothetical protein